jgi:hypothetical protein
MNKWGILILIVLMIGTTVFVMKRGKEKKKIIM